MLDREEIRLVLDDWNHWHRDLPRELLGHPRRLTQVIQGTATGREIVALIGIRRCGKTTVLYQLIASLLGDGVKPSSILFLNLEDHRLALHRTVQLFDDVLAFYREEVDPTGPRYLFLDEVQAIPDWERWVRSVHDLTPTMRIFVTGSSSSLMSSELSSLLTGRNLTFLARPFSFEEYLSSAGVEVTCTSDPGDAYKENLALREPLAFHLARYMRHGGFPEPLMSDNERRREALLRQYFDDIVAKDVIRRHRLRNHGLVENLALVLMSNVANLASLGRLATTLGTSASAIRSLLDHLRDAQLFQVSRFFSFSERESVSIQKPRKVYAVDTGLRNAVVSRPTDDRGWLAENLVYNHLSFNGVRTSYWREEVEVDMVMGITRPTPLNVCFADEIPQRELRSLLRFNERFDNEEAWLVTRGSFREEQVGSCCCRLIPLWAFLLARP